LQAQKRLLSVLFGTLLLDMVGFGMVFPIIPIIFTDPSSPAFLLHGYSRGSQLFVAGAITALWGLMQFIAAPLLGQLSDVYGRKKLLTFGIAVLALSQFMFGAGIGIASLTLLFIARAIAGIAAGNVSIAQASIADATDPKDRAKNFGLIGAAIGLGLILGPLISGWIVGWLHNPAAPFITAGVIGIINVLFVTIFLPETNLHPKTEHTFAFTRGLSNIAAAARDAQIRLVYLTSFLYILGINLMISFYGIFLVGVFKFSAKETGMAFAGVGLSIIIAQLVVLRFFAKRYAERVLLPVTVLLVALFVGLSVCMPSAALFVALIPFISVPHGMTLALLPALVSKSAAAEKQGAALGINASLVALGTGLAPILAGVAAALLGVRMPFLVGACCILIAWFVLLSYLRRRRAPAEVMPEAAAQ